MYLHTLSIASAAQVDNWLNVIQEFIADKYQFVGVVTAIYTVVYFKRIAWFKGHL